MLEPVTLVSAVESGKNLDADEKTVLRALAKGGESNLAERTGLEEHTAQEILGFFHSDATLESLFRR